MASRLAISSLILSFSIVLILSGHDGAYPEEALKLDSQGKIDLKESMKDKGEIIVPLDQLDKLDPEQIKGKRKEIIYGKKPPKTGNIGRAFIDKHGSKIENRTTPLEENLQGIKVMPDQAEAPPAHEEKNPNKTP